MGRTLSFTCLALSLLTLGLTLAVTDHVTGGGAACLAGYIVAFFAREDKPYDPTN